MGYKIHAYKGLTWMALLRVTVRGITFVRLAILARILTPAQFGVFGVATIVLSFLEVLTETGINIFLVQKKDKYFEFINSAWVISIARGVLISLLLILLAKPISIFFNSPESFKAVLLIALVPFIRGFINPSIINIQRELQFHKEFYLRATLLIVDSIIAITVAFITRSAVSMAYGLIISAFVELTLSFVLFRPLPKFKFEFIKAKHIGKNGWWVTITGIFLYFSDNLDNIAVGRILGTEFLGLYQNAYKLSTLTISEVVETVNKVTFPVYTKFSNDKIRLFNAFRKVTYSSSGIALLLGLIIFIFANQLVLILLGNQWLAAIPVVKILAIYGIFRTMFGNFSALFLSLGKQKYVAVATFIRLLVLALLIIPLISFYGMIGAGYAMLISVFAEIPILFYFYRYKLKN